MDSAHDFTLLGELVLQVRVLVRTLALLGFFQYIYICEKLKKIPEGQEYPPRLEPTAPICLADRNRAHYPSRHCTILNKRRLNDGLPAHANRSTRESSADVTSTLDAPTSKVRSDIFPRSRRASSQALENTSLLGAQRTKIYYSERKESE